VRGRQRDGRATHYLVVDEDIQLKGEEEEDLDRRSSFHRYLQSSTTP
jgi:hypothetical protein